MEAKFRNYITDLKSNDWKERLYDMAVMQNLKIEFEQDKGWFRTTTYFTVTGEANKVDWFRRNFVMMNGEDDPGPSNALCKINEPKTNVDYFIFLCGEIWKFRGKHD